MGEFQRLFSIMRIMPDGLIVDVDIQKGYSGAATIDDIKNHRYYEFLDNCDKKKFAWVHRQVISGQEPIGMDYTIYINNVSGLRRARIVPDGKNAVVVYQWIPEQTIM